MKQLLKLVHSVMREERWTEAIRILNENSSMLEMHWELVWNLGWCYLKLDWFHVAAKHLRKALRLVPDNPVCKYGLAQVYLKQKRWKSAEVLLYQTLQAREWHAARIGLALAYLEQGRIGEAEQIHLIGIKLKPKRSERYESYAAFLSMSDATARHRR
jgi:Flp pilus assembly protein TadD